MRDATIRSSETTSQAHRRIYPEQYAHRLVGCKVRARGGIEGVVVRVVPSRFGELAILDSQPPTTAFAVGDLVCVERTREEER